METASLSEPGPSPNGNQTAGRDARGRFVKGCAPGPGNPYAAEVGKRRGWLMKAIKVKDIDLAVQTIREVMTKGKDRERLRAAALLLERALGAPIAADIDERLRALEVVLARKPSW